MAEYLRIGRMYFVLLAIFAVARFALVMAFPYAKAHHVFSIFVLTVLAPTALNQTEAVPLARAIGIRAPALVIFPVINAIMAAIGWALGGLLPTEAAARVSPAMPPVASSPRVVA